MPGIRYSLIILGAPMAAASAEIDLITAEQLRMVLLEAGRRGHATVVADLTRTRFCDSAGLSVLTGAYRRAVAEGGELRLVQPAEGAAASILTVTGLDRQIPSFTRLGQALALVPGRRARNHRRPGCWPCSAQTRR